MRRYLLILVSASLCCLASYSAAHTPSYVGVLQKQVRYQCQGSSELISSPALGDAILLADNLVNSDISGGTNYGKVDLLLRLTGEPLSTNQVIANKAGFELHQCRVHNGADCAEQYSTARRSARPQAAARQAQRLSARRLAAALGRGWLASQRESGAHKLPYRAPLNGLGKSTTPGLDTGSPQGRSHHGNLHPNAKLDHKLAYTSLHQQPHPVASPNPTSMEMVVSIGLQHWRCIAHQS